MGREMTPRICAVFISLLVMLYLSGQVAANGAAQINQSGNSLRLCFNSAANTTAMRMAVYNGINCFRTDLHINSAYESGYITNTSDIGAQWLGILDYATVNSTNWTLSDWNASVSEAVAQYPQIREWEIWNEPEYFGSSYQDWNSTHYFYMIRSASMIIKSRYPNDTVVCFGGATTHPLFGSNSVAYEYPFYEQAWKLGASKYCDAISLHAYDDYQQYNLSKLGYNGNGLTMGGEWNYTIGLYENLTHKPIWITETGLESPNSYTDSNEQTLYMNQTLRVLSASPFVKRVYWFQLASYPNFPWGLIQLPYFGFQQMEIKPAWNIYVNFSKNEGRKPSLTTAPTTSMPEGKTVNSTIASTTAPAAVNQGPEPQNANNKGEVLAALVIIVILAAYFYSKRRKTAQQT